MYERGRVLKAKMKRLGLKAKDVSQHCKWSTDTIRAMDRQSTANGTLDEIEAAIEKAKERKMRVLQAG